MNPCHAHPQILPAYIQWTGSRARCGSQARSQDFPRGGGVLFGRKVDLNGVFTPEQDNDKTTTRQMLNLCIPMKPFNICLVVVLSLSCSGVKTPLA